MSRLYLEGRYVYGDDIYIDDYYMDEIWADIEGIDDYMVSNKARVWSKKTQSFLKVKPLDKHGHLGVCLYQDGQRIYRYIHRLVAEAFIPNPHNLPVVRHLEDRPYLNEPDDLEWGTQRENAYDAMRNGRAYILTDEDRYKGNKDRMTPLVAINLTTGEELYFESQGEASRVLRLPQANIWKVLHGERYSAGGYTFRKGGISNERYY